MKIKKIIMAFAILCLVLFPSSTTWATEWVEMDNPPGLDYVLVDPSIKYPDGSLLVSDVRLDWFSGSTSPTMKKDFDTWDKVTTFLDSLTVKSGVALMGHGDYGAHGPDGASGEFSWGGTPVLVGGFRYDPDPTTTWLNLVKDNINFLGFISCSTGADTAFLNEVATKLGGSYGYTAEIRNNTTTWPDGTYKSHIWEKEEGCSLVWIPEPASLLLLSMGSLMILRRRRRKELKV